MGTVARSSTYVGTEIFTHLRAHILRRTGRYVWIVGRHSFSGRLEVVGSARLGELVQTTDDQWMTRGLSGARTATHSARTKSRSGWSLASVTAVVGTPRGIAEPATPWRTGAVEQALHGT